jgi:hypothetical protein
VQWRKPFIHLTNSEAQMSSIGRVESVWRYPVKSMCGEQMPEIFASFAGSHGDRLYAFKSSVAPAGFPYFTGGKRMRC